MENIFAEFWPDDQEEDINDEEIVQAVKAMKNNKAAGVDGIAAELIKHGGQRLQDEVIKIFKMIWAEEDIPQEWRTGIYVPIHKKNDRYVCENYRGICLLTIGYKILSKVLCARLMPHYTRSIGEYQAGFMPSKSTIDNVFVVRQLSEKYREYGRTAWHIFVDYRQAYDSVHRPSLWSILRQFSVPEKLVRLIQACYANSKGCVKVGGELTSEFDVDTGLRQGFPLSCMLFNTCIALE